jgi:hypothetical protein
VGAPRQEFNPVSGIGNSCATLAGPSASRFNDFIIRQGQIHRNSLSEHTNRENLFFERQLNAMTQSLKANPIGASEAAHRALPSFSLR